MKRHRSISGVILALVIPVCAATAGAADGPLRLLKDVNPVSEGDASPRFIGTATRPDGREAALFTAMDGLWASDGCCARSRSRRIDREPLVARRPQRLFVSSSIGEGWAAREEGGH